MENITGFFYTPLELGDETPAQPNKPFDGMTHGDFTDMWGFDVHISKRDLQSYLANTLDAIKASTTASGQIVGLPIDCVAHERGNAAGWITDVELVGDVIKFTPIWTELGIDLIKRNLQRMFSPTLNLKNKVVMGGSLTNWPATRDKKGRVLIKPIELSESTGSFTYHLEFADEEEEVTKEDKEVTPAGDSGLENTTQLEGENQMPSNEELLQVAREEFHKIFGDLASPTNDQVATLVGTIRQQVTQQIQEENERLQHDLSMDSLAASLVRGSDNVPTGIPVEEKDLAAALKKLPRDQVDFWKKVLSDIQTSGVVNFSERGHGKEGGGLKELPVEVIARLESKEFTIEDLSNPILGLGDLKEYDLSKWQK